mmetsp:Transcript_6508/g.17074  ORF Transcript_6508/g.17074 Transcript_6508/m.17074 type:complete len:246 (-) Transcript_6508:92-829(-)
MRGSLAGVFHSFLAALQLFHQAEVVVQPPGCVTDDDVRGVVVHGLRHRGCDDLLRLHSLTEFSNRGRRPVGPFRKLLHGSSSKRVARSKKDVQSRLSELMGQLAHRSRLPAPVHTNDQDHGGPGIAQLQRGIAAPGVQYVLDGLLQGAADVVSRLELSIHDAAANAVHDFECGFRAEVGCNQQVLELLQRVIGLVQIPEGEQLIQHPEALPRLARSFEYSVCVRNSLFLQHTDGLLKRPGAAFCG